MSADKQKMSPRTAVAYPAWYRHPWPWIFISMLTATVIAGGVTLWLAVSTSDGLVADDYYKQGLGINRQLARSERATALDLNGRMRFSASELMVSLTGRDGAQLPRRLRVVFSHPTRAGLDRALLLDRDGPDWRGRFEPLPPGRWTVSIEDEQATWRLDAAAHFPEDREITLSAAPFKSVD